MEIVCSALSQPLVLVVELSSDDEMDKPHESDNDDEEESTQFVQTETKPLKLPSGAVRGNFPQRALKAISNLY